MVFAVVCALCLLPSPCMFLPGEGEELGRIYEQLLLLLEGLCLDPIGQLDRDVIIVDASENFVNFADLGIIQSTYHLSNERLVPAGCSRGIWGH